MAAKTLFILFLLYMCGLLNYANYFIARRQVRCYRTVTLRNRGLTLSQHVLRHTIRKRDGNEGRGVEGKYNP